MSPRELCLFSSVGNRPAAIATAVATWQARPMPKLTHLALLFTSWTERYALRLADFARTHGIQPIFVNLELERGFKDATAVVGELSAVNRTLVYDVSPGMAWVAANYARALPADSPLLFTHDDGIALFDASNTESPWVTGSLENLGWDALLRLHDPCISYKQAQGVGRTPLLAAALDNTRSQVLPMTRERVQFEGLGHPLDLAYERCGQLYALVVIDGDNANQMMSKARALSNAKIRSLDVKISVLTSHARIAERCRALGMAAVRVRQANNGYVLDRTNRLRLLTWLNGGPEPRSRPIVPVVQRHHIPNIPDLPTVQNKGRANDETTLHVHLGENTAPTLNSLFTHEPDRAHVYYDARTRSVVKKARWLAEQAASLPVGVLEFHRTDMLDSNMPAILDQTIEDPDGKHIADISPGTNGQTAMMARDRRLELWSQDNLRAMARPLAKGRGIAKELIGPPITVLAVVQGGPLRDEGTTCLENAPALRFYRLLARYVAQHRAANRLQGIHPGDLDQLQHASKPDCSLGSDNNGRWVVRVDGDQASSSVPRKFVRGGHWLDLLVGYTMAAIGADEVRIGLRWAWQTRQGGIDPNRKNDQHGRPVFRDDIDVVARFGHRYVAVECKTGSRERWAVVGRTTFARARGGFGRFAHPMVVGFEPRWDTSLVSPECIPFDIATLLDQDQTKEHLDEVFLKHSSTRRP